VLYEAPHRIVGTLADIQAELGQRRVGIGRELTKLHEQLAIRPINEWLLEPPKTVGEFVLIIAPPEDRDSDGEAVEPALLAKYFWQLANNQSLPRRELMRRVAKQFNVRVRDVFIAVEAAKKSVE
jgi:16S rRNA (cytidine1402-2'-O)-methyltransferase